MSIHQPATSAQSITSTRPTTSTRRGPGTNRRGRGTRRRIAIGLSVVLLGSGVATATAAEHPAAPAVELPPEVERLLPPGGRALSGALRVINSLGARNQVYREAREVQRDLREYYDAQLATAKKQLANRELAGLSDSQVATYVRVVERLEREKRTALDITEREKNDARLQFQGRLVETIAGVLITTPRVRDGMTQLRGAIEDLKGAFEVAAAAADGQNPLEVALRPVRERLERYSRIAGTASLVTGELGRRVNELLAEAQGVLDGYDGASADASEAATGIAGRLDSLIGEVDDLLETGRRARGADDIDAAGRALIDALLTPGSDDPATDSAADAIARQLGLDPSVIEALGLSSGDIDPATLATMRERVRGEILRRRTEGIAEQCGAIVGAARRANGGSDEDLPCELYSDPDRVIDLLRGSDEPPSSDVPSGEDAAPVPPPPVAVSTTTIPPTTTTTTTIPPTTTTTTTTTIPPTTTTTTTTTTLPPLPPNIDTVISYGEQFSGSGEAIATSIQVVVNYAEGGAATVSYSGSSSSSWRRTFPCIFDNDLNRPTGDSSVVEYVFGVSAANSGSTTAGSDGSLSITLPYSLSGSISGSQIVLYAADCAYLNGNAAPNTGGYSASGQIVISVDSGGFVSVNTNWSGGLT